MVKKQPPVWYLWTPGEWDGDLGVFKTFSIECDFISGKEGPFWRQMKPGRCQPVFPYQEDTTREKKE